MEMELAFKYSVDDAPLALYMQNLGKGAILQVSIGCLSLRRIALEDHNSHKDTQAFEHICRCEGKSNN